MRQKQEVDSQTLDAVERFLSMLIGRYELAGAVLYGSRARGTHLPDSDADVAVLLRGERGSTLRTALAMSTLAYDVLLETGINISPLPIWLDDWEHPEQARNPLLLRNIAADGVWL